MTRDQAIALFTAAGQPYALADQVLQGRHLRVFTNAPRSLRAMFEATATDAPFISYEDERYSFQQAWAAASRIGQVLVQRCGVKHGDRVAISMRNYPEWMLAFCAITSVGGVAVAMNAHWQADDLTHALQDSGARVLFADNERLQRLAECPAITDLQVLAVRCGATTPGAAEAIDALAAKGCALGGRLHHLHELTGALGDVVGAALGTVGGAVTMPAVEIAPDDLATLLYTSGSTGHPKGVPSSHRNILSALLSWELDRRASELAAGIEPVAPEVQAGTLLAVPLFHVTGLHASYLSCYRLQRRLVAMYRWDADAAAALVERERLSSLVAPAALSGDMVRVAAEKRYDLSSLLMIGGGGAPRAPEQVRQIRATFSHAMPGTGWGMTETNAIGTGILGEEYLQRPASSGRCSQVLQLKVIDEQGQALPTGARGELLVRGTSVFAGYWRRPEANAQAFIGDWFRTGDVAYLDDEGYLFIVDRIKDLIIRGGENIGCGAVEAALMLHPEVIEAAVYAVPDDRLGEEVGATVYCRSAVPAEALREFVGQHLARFEVPRFLSVTQTPLPRTPSGKLLKREVRLQALKGLAARVDGD